MKITLNSIRNISQIFKTSDDLTSIGQEELVKKIGAQLGEVEEVTELGPKYQGIIIAKVISCEKHPNADKLSVCLVDDGGVAKDVERNKDGLVQVVCGATNVRAGLIVAWLPPGATVPSSVDSDPFILGARELRGVISSGMLASPKELALGDNHEGILEIDGNHQAGSDFAKTFKLSDEVVIDIENKMFTHRPDCFGWLGVSRELAGIQGKPFSSPDWYTASPLLPEVKTESLPLKVINELPELAPRFTAIALANVVVGDSPVWLQVLLTKIGQKSVNNIVDLTNYYMYLTGQPLHAYDYDKVNKLTNEAGAAIIVRHPNPGEKIALLNGKEIEPRSEAIMIATDNKLIGVGGVIGGSETEVDRQTTSIILECANFDMYSVRRTSMTHGLFTDAVTRFTKGQSPLQCLAVLIQSITHIQSLAGGELASRVIDTNQELSNIRSLHDPVVVSADFINQRLGLRLTDKEIISILENVEFNVSKDAHNLIVEAPFWRTDIEIAEDIVEEVGRLYGFDNLPLELPTRSLAPAITDKTLQTKSDVRQRLTKAGANEVLTYSFVHGDLLNKAGQDANKAFQISNALSPDLQYYRVSLMPSLLEKVHLNIKAGYTEFAIYELGKTHGEDIGYDESGLPKEDEVLAFLISAADKLKKPGSAYYRARKYLNDLAGLDLRYEKIPDELADLQIAQPYEPSRSAIIRTKQGEFLGIIGEFKPTVRTKLKLPEFTAGFELDVNTLGEILSKPTDYQPLSRFPKVKQDITLRLDTKISFQELNDFLQSEMSKIVPESSLHKFNLVDIYQSESDTKHKNYSFQLDISSSTHTLTDKEVVKLLDLLSEVAKDKFGATRI